MTRFSLVRRRQVWLPTLIGWILLAIIAVAVALVTGFLIHPFLALNEPASGARLLVVEGWLGTKELDQAMEVARRGSYDMVVTTGGPIERWSELSGSSNYANLARNYLAQQGLQNLDLTAVPAPASAQDRTFLSAVKLRQWTQQQGLAIKSLDVFSAGTHARRSRMLFQMAFGPGVAVGVMAARSAQYDPERWWRSSAGAKSVFGEATSLAWTVCCFHPPPPGSHEELWAVSRQSR
jgi:hypothetical protein